MKTHKKELTQGIVLLIGFTAILIMLFSPVLNGQKPINYFDDLYNSISKGSVYYIPGLASESDQFNGAKIETTIAYLTLEQAEEMLQFYEMAGIKSEKQDDRIAISADLGLLLSRSLADSDALFHNLGSKVSSVYHLNEKKALYYWWLTLKGVEKELNKEKRFAEAKFVGAVITKAVECSYNYYKVIPRQISEEVLFVVFSLIFYVIYTLWFGYAIMYIFIGVGLRLDH